MILRLSACPATLSFAKGSGWSSPLSEALASVATEVHKLRERVKKLEGLEEKGEPPSEPLQRIMDDLDYQI